MISNPPAYLHRHQHSFLFYVDGTYTNAVTFLENSNWAEHVLLLEDMQILEDLAASKPATATTRETIAAIKIIAGSFENPFINTLQGFLHQSERWGGASYSSTDLQRILANPLDAMPSIEASPNVSTRNYLGLEQIIILADRISRGADQATAQQIRQNIEVLNRIPDIIQGNKLPLKASTTHVHQADSLESSHLPAGLHLVMPVGRLGKRARGAQMMLLCGNSKVHYPLHRKQRVKVKYTSLGLHTPSMAQAA